MSELPRNRPPAADDGLGVPERSVVLPPRPRTSRIPWLLLSVLILAAGAWATRAQWTPWFGPVGSAPSVEDGASAVEAPAPEPVAPAPIEEPASATPSAPVAAPPAPAAEMRRAQAPHVRPDTSARDKARDKARAEAAKIDKLRRSLPPPDLPPADH